ncbi:hypothetical protein BJ741DRAFT_593024 [Chytriomyces cf. hyalinus JEL632]|nr:hypothetical protein BJ741DRAFT_593024 [Chytriomyces cf. hyalinus JEL632]
MRIPTHLLWTQASVLLPLLAMHVAAQGNSATGGSPSQTLLPSSVTAQPTDSAGPPSASSSQSDQPNPPPTSSTVSTLPPITTTGVTLPSSETLLPSNITSADPDASASIVTGIPATVTATTDNPLDPATLNGPSCMFISSTSVCHSYSGYAINRRSSLLQMPNSPVTDASVADFDSLILRSASAGAKTLLADVCLSWDESRIRYAYNYFCDYYLQNPLIIGSSPESVRGSATDCNVIMNPAQQATLPRIGSSPCRAFKSTVSNYTTYCLRPPSIFATAANIQATIEFTCTTATADPEIPSVNISEPNATEHLLCGFGRLSYDSTAALRAAYSHCLPAASTSSDPCCTWDPAIQRALKSGGVAALEKGPAYTCQLTTATGQVSCGQLIGGIFGFFMSILSVVIVWVRVWKIRGYLIKPKGGVYPSGGVDAVAEKHSVDAGSRQGMGTVTMNRVRNVGFQDAGSDSSAGNTARSRGESHRHSAIIALTRFDHVQGPASPVSTMNKVATLRDVHNRINSPQFAGGQMVATYTPPPPSPRSTGFNGPYQASAPSPRSQSLGHAGMTVSFRDTPPRSASSNVDPVAEMLGSPIPNSNAFEQFTVVRDFLGQPGSSQLEWAGAGDRVRVLRGVGADGMMHVRNLETGVEGGVPVNILARM